MVGVSPETQADLNAATPLREGQPALSSAAVVFGDDRRPEAATHIRLEAFEGPLGLLLSLIEARQLDILTVPLGALAGSYLEALATLDGNRIANVSAFVAVAGQLILIKSRAMLPRPSQADSLQSDETEDPEAELRARLLLYRAFRDAGAALQAQAENAGRMFRREPGAAQAAGRAGAIAPPTSPIEAAVLVASLERLAVVLPPPEQVSEAYPRMITMQERADMIRAALTGADQFVLQDLLAGLRDRVLVAVTFLAMLELMKRREIVAEQAEPWGPIVVRRPFDDPA